MKKLSIFLLIFSMILSSITPAYSRPRKASTATIQGRVTNSITNQAVSSAAVRAGRYSAITNANGNYVIKNIKVWFWGRIFRVKASAKGYHSRSRWIYVRKDKTYTLNFNLRPRKPLILVNITSPEDNSYITGTNLDVSVSWQGRAGIIDLYLDDSLAGSYRTWRWWHRSGNHTFKVGLSSQEDGEHKLKAIAYRSHKRRGYKAESKEITFILDNTPPVISELSPADNSLLNNNQPEISAVLEDATSGIDKGTIVLKLDDAEVTPTYDEITGKLSYTSETMLSDGTHTVLIEVKDNAGNGTSATSTFTVDVTPPVITDVLPENGVTITENKPTILAEYSDNLSGIDLSSVKLLLDSQDVTSNAIVTNTKITYTPTQDLESVEHTAMLEVKDIAGNEATGIWMFTIKEKKIAIHNCEELQAMRNNLSANYYLANDIDASATSGWNGGLGFEPISTFTGIFDGNGHTITGLFINRSGLFSTGLFQTSGAEIKNVGLIDVDITGEGNHVGGLCGYDGNYSTITNCYSTGNVSGSSYATGGLIGGNDDCIYNNCYSTCSVSGNSWVGGLIGGNDGSTITNCYSAGAVSGNSYLGGLIGRSFSGNTYNDDFWDTETSGQSTSQGGTGKTTAEMKQEATFANWDFDDVWGIDEGVIRPFLKILGVVKDITPPLITDVFPQDGSIVYYGTPTISAKYSDVASGIDIATVKILVNGADVTANSAITDKGVSYTPEEKLPEGEVTVEIEVRDNAGNLAIKEFVFEIQVSIDDILNSIKNNTEKIIDMRANMTVNTFYNSNPFGDTLYCKYYLKGADKEKTETFTDQPRTVKKDIVIVQGTNLHNVDPATGEYETLDLLKEFDIDSSILSCIDIAKVEEFKQNNNISVQAIDGATGIGRLTAIPRIENKLYSKIIADVDYTKGIIIKIQIFRKDEKTGEERLEQTIETLESQEIDNIWIQKKMEKIPAVTNADLYMIMEYSDIEINTNLNDDIFDPTKQ